MAEITVEDKFRSSLEDLLALAKKFLPVCERVEDLIGMVQLAIENEGQLKLLLKEYVRQK